MNNRLSDEEFYSIYNKVPRFAIDLAIKSDEGVLFSLRAIEPYKGLWHLPGGTLYKGETVSEAAQRIAKKETNLDVRVTNCLGYMEFLNEIRSGVPIHSISLVMEVASQGGDLHHDSDSQELKWYKELPEGMVEEHFQFLKSKSFLM